MIMMILRKKGGEGGGEGRIKEEDGGRVQDMKD